MPFQINNLLEPLQNLKYIDYSLLLQSLNTPVVWGVLAIGAIAMVFAFASYRKHLFHTSMTGAGIGVLIGVVLTLLVEGLLVYKFIGLDRITSLFQAKPSPVTILPGGKSQVLGNSTVCPSTPATLSEFLSLFAPQKARELKLSLCQEVLRELK